MSDYRDNKDYGDFRAFQDYETPRDDASPTPPSPPQTAQNAEDAESAQSPLTPLFPEDAESTQTARNDSFEPLKTPPSDACDEPDADVPPFVAVLVKCVILFAVGAGGILYHSAQEDAKLEKLDQTLEAVEQIIKEAEADPRYQAEQKRRARRERLARPTVAGVERLEALPETELAKLLARTRAQADRWTARRFGAGTPNSTLRLRSEVGADWSVNAEAEAARQAGTRQTLTLYGDNPEDDVELAFRWIPTGTFAFGSPLDEPGRAANDVPQRQATIERGFWLLETETTERMQMRVTQNRYGSTPYAVFSLTQNADAPIRDYRLRALLYSFPATSVSWSDALRFCDRLNELDGKPVGFKFRLPTEVEWEYACRAGTTTPYNVGERLTEDDASFLSFGAADAFGNYTAPDYAPANVASFPPNAWGLYDMPGNVGEMCVRSADAPLAVEAGDSLFIRERYDHDRYVLRGGSWASKALDCRSASRAEPTNSSRPVFLRPSSPQSVAAISADDSGFRIALVPDVATSADDKRPIDASTSAPATLDDSNDRRKAKLIAKILLRRRADQPRDLATANELFRKPISELEAMAAEEPTSAD